MAISIGNHISAAQSVCNDDSRLMNHFSHEVANQVREVFCRIINRWPIRKAETQQIHSIDPELFRQCIGILAPLKRGSARCNGVDQQKWLCIAVALYLVKYIPILPGIFSLFTGQRGVECASL